MEGKNKLIIFAVIGAGLAVFGLFNGLPHFSSGANTDTLNDYLMYAVTYDTGQLVRYSFADNTSQVVAEVHLKDGTVLTGIEASAHVPRSTNIFGFWTDPADRLTKLVYIDTKNAEASIVGLDLGPSVITGAVATKPGGVIGVVAGAPTPFQQITGFEMYAVQGAPQIPFVIVDGQVIPSIPYAAKVTVIGAAIESGNYDQAVTVKVCIGNDVAEPFGPSGQAVAGNVNDMNNPRHYVFMNGYAADSPISITGTSWAKIDNQSTGDLESDWAMHMSVNSLGKSSTVKVLRNGDPVPDIPGFRNQNSLAAYIAEYTDTTTNTISLDKNQAIYLFELGTTDLASAAADFQDLVMLVSLAKAPMDFAGPGGMPSNQLIKVDPKTGTFVNMMPLSRVYDSLAATQSELFYASDGEDLYQIDPASQTETLLGKMQHPHNSSLEFAGGGLLGFSTTAGRVWQVDLGSMQMIGSSFDTGFKDLSTIIFSRAIDETPYPAYD